MRVVTTAVARTLARVNALAKVLPVPAQPLLDRPKMPFDVQPHKEELEVEEDAEEAKVRKLEDAQRDTAPLEPQYKPEVQALEPQNVPALSRTFVQPYY